MASDQSTHDRAEAAAERPGRRLYEHGPSVFGALVAIAALVTFWYVFLRPKVARSGEEVARLTGVVGEVQRKPFGQEAWTRTRPSERLHVGDVVQTEPRGAAEITFDSGSVVHVRPDSVIHIGGSAESSTAAWRVQTGRIHFAAGERATAILTPTARTTAEAHAAGDIDVAASGATGVKVFEGRARIETRDQRITLDANEAVQVDSAGRAGAKVDLPPPPTLVAPPSRARFSAGETASLKWTAVAASTSYRLAVDYNVTQANLLLAAPPTLDIPGIAATAHDLTSLDAGRYFWRVAAVDARGLEGAFSHVSLFTVVEPEPRPEPTATARAAAPNLVIDALQPVAAGVVQLTGRTEPEAKVTVNGAAVQVMPDGSFSEYVQGVRGGSLVVRAVVRGVAQEKTLPLPQ